MCKTVTTSLNLFLFLLAACFITSCFAPTPVVPPEKEPPQKEPPEIDTTGTVPADGVLEAVTWNIEWYGNTGNGPDDETRQTENVLAILDTLNADLYAFQEISSGTSTEPKESLKKLTSRMKGYRGFVAEAMGGGQKTAFVFNTITIDSVSSGLITEGQDDYNWASGRYPFYFKFNYSTNDTTILIYAVTIHAKCCADAESYRRRKEAAKSLYNYLTRNKPSANIILLGDYNDDADVSIYQERQSPYQVFVDDDESFKVITKSLSLKGQSTTVGFPDAVDHVTMSNELFDAYILESEKALTKAAALIENYELTTSDHYPVWVKFEF